LFLVFVGNGVSAHRKFETYGAAQTVGRLAVIDVAIALTEIGRKTQQHPDKPHKKFKAIVWPVSTPDEREAMSKGFVKVRRLHGMLATC
jgi:hypothetical protein